MQTQVLWCAFYVEMYFISNVYPDDSFLPEGESSAVGTLKKAFFVKLQEIMFPHLPLEICAVSIGSAFQQENVPDENCQQRVGY